MGTLLTNTLSTYCLFWPLWPVTGLVLYFLVCLVQYQNLIVLVCWSQGSSPIWRELTSLSIFPSYSLWLYGLGWNKQLSCFDSTSWYPYPPYGSGCLEEKLSFFFKCVIARNVAARSYYILISWNSAALLSTTVQYFGCLLFQKVDKAAC